MTAMAPAARFHTIKGNPQSTIADMRTFFREHGRLAKDAFEVVDIKPREIDVILRHCDDRLHSAFLARFTRWTHVLATV